MRGKRKESPEDRRGERAWSGILMGRLKREVERESAVERGQGSGKKL